MYGATRPGGKPWLSEFENKVVQYFGKVIYFLSA
jgi:hypothetical protein